VHVFRGAANLEERIAINDGTLTPQARPCMVLVAIKNATCREDKVSGIVNLASLSGSLPVHHCLQYKNSPLCKQWKS
jgi:hypothetical protein